MATTSLGFENFFSTTLSSSITDSDTTISLNAVPTPSEGFLVIEPDNSSKREVVYYTSKGASSVTVPSGAGNGRGYDGTTATSHDSGVSVIMAPVAAMFEALQDGTGLSDAAVTPAKLTSGTGSSWAWQSWTPTYTSITVGDGTVTAKYCQIGKTVIAEWYLVMGSTSSASNGCRISFPVTPNSRYNSGSADIIVGQCSAFDSGTALHLGNVCAYDGSEMQFRWDDGTGSKHVTTFPFLETTGDTFGMRVVYEAA